MSGSLGKVLHVCSWYKSDDLVQNLSGQTVEFRHPRRSSRYETGCMKLPLEVKDEGDWSFSKSPQSPDLSESLLRTGP